MNPLNSLFTTLLYTSTTLLSALHSDSSSFRNRMIGIFNAILLASGTPLASTRHDIEKKLEGGLMIVKPNFDALSRLPPKFGPFLSSELSCYLNSISPSESCFSSTIISPIDQYATAIKSDLSSEIKIYIDTIKPSQLPQHRERTTRYFPKNFSAFLLTATGLIKNGSSGCNFINSGLEIYPQCEELIEKAKESIRGKEDNFYTQWAFERKGMGVGFPQEDGSTFYGSLCINPLHHANYVKALDFVSSKLLQNDCFFRQHENDIESFFLNLHELFFTDIDPQIGGQYRQENVLVFKNDHLPRTPEALMKELIHQGANKAEIQLFRNSLGDLLKSTDEPKFWDQFLSKSLEKSSEKAAEKKIWQRFLYFPPAYNELKSLMNRFFKKLKRYTLQEVHPIALAAWCHCELIRIHPFIDGNGRLARLLMNALLVRGGYEPVIIDNEEAYLKALRDDETYPGTYAEYLAELIKEQYEGIQILIPSNE